MNLSEVQQSCKTFSSSLVEAYVKEMELISSPCLQPADPGRPEATGLLSMSADGLAAALESLS
jgi:hypothetical protein